MENPGNVFYATFSLYRTISSCRIYVSSHNIVPFSKSHIVTRSVRILCGIEHSVENQSKQLEQKRHGIVMVDFLQSKFFSLKL